MTLIFERRSTRFTDQGHVVCCAVNEAQALAYIDQSSFDFALVDVRLHGGAEDDESGLSLALALRALKPEYSRYPADALYTFQTNRAGGAILRRSRFHRQDADWDEQITKVLQMLNP